MKVLVVDDDPELLPLVVFALRREGFLALEAASGERAIALVRAERPDLIVLDVNLPGIDGFEVCRRLRQSGDATPILLLTVRGDEEDQVRGLDLGADDYLTKPFSPRTLLARARALLRRAGIEQSRRIEAGEIVLDEETQSVRVAGGARCRLTPLEFRLLRLLSAHAGRPVPAERILVHVWGTSSAGDRQLLKQLVHRLRRKIEEDPAHPRRLCTEPGLGYRLGVPEERNGRKV
ncbi:MAG TPA: response regulator transcription factor [Candidatus Saccharimonadales bacterium]|nr:response regulator transcription factor [Candidatus Saccharimonadales bacterium]